MSSIGRRLDMPRPADHDSGSKRRGPPFRPYPSEWRTIAPNSNTRSHRQRIPMKGLASTLAKIGRLAIPYYRSEDRWAGLTLLAGVVAIELSHVYITVVLNAWYNRFYT